MRIAVLVKQIPEPEQLAMEDGRIVREGVALTVNAYCRRANAKAVELAGSEGEVVVLTMGPPSAEDALREMIACGADRGIHLCDPAFAGSDTLATAVALASALRREEPFDLVLAGLNSLDADTGQVPAAVAELLGLPFAAGVRSLEIGDSDAPPGALAFTARLETDDGYRAVTGRLPAVLSASERLCRPSKAPPDRQMEVEAGRITRLAASDLDVPLRRLGAAGSPTSVGPPRILGSRRRPKSAASASEAIDMLVGMGVLTTGHDTASGGDDPERGHSASADALPSGRDTVSRQREGCAGVSGGHGSDRGRHREPRAGDSPGAGDRPDVWCFFTDLDAGIELLEAAAGLARDIDGAVTAVTADSALAGNGPHLRGASPALPDGMRIAPGHVGLAHGVPQTMPRAPAAVCERASSDRAAAAVPQTASRSPAAVNHAGLSLLLAAGADRVLVIPDVRAGSPWPLEPAEQADALAAAAVAGMPWALLVEGTRSGRSVAAAVAARHGWGLTGDAIKLEVGADKRLIAWKPAFNGRLEVPIRSRSPVQMATVRPGALIRPPRRPAAAVLGGSEGEQAEPVDTARQRRSAGAALSGPELRSAHLSGRPRSSSRAGAAERFGDVLLLPAPAPAPVATTALHKDGFDVSELRRAAAVVVVGQGVDPVGYPLIDELRDALGGAALGATRRVTDKGWLPRGRQIGVTGHCVSPRLLVSVGASGRFNHTVGLQNAQAILAVNPDRDAEIFEQADVGVVGSWQQVLPDLIAEIKPRVAEIKPQAPTVRHPP